MDNLSKFPDLIVSPSLQNTDIYKNQFLDKLSIIFHQYNLLIKDYMNIYTDTIKITNTEYYNYLLLNGIKTINNIFNIILLYTNNLTATYFYCQKSYFIC